MGVEKSLAMMNQADLILFVLNNNEEITKEIEKLLQSLGNKNYIIILNKIDLPSKVDLNHIKIEQDRLVKMSIVNKEGIEELKQKIVDLFNMTEIEEKDPTYLSSARSISILENALTKIEEVEESIQNNLPIDMIEMDIKVIWEELGKINGSTYEEELLDEMFSRFCLGK